MSYLAPTLIINPALFLCGTFQLLFDPALHCINNAFGTVLCKKIGKVMKCLLGLWFAPADNYQLMKEQSFVMKSKMKLSKNV